MALTHEAVPARRGGAAGMDEDAPRSGPRRWPLVIATLAVLLVLVATRLRPAWGYDSLIYASVGRHLQRTGDLALPSLFPPGESLLLLVTGTGTRLLLLNCLVLWATLLVVHRLAWEVTGSERAALAVQLWTAVSLSTLSVYSFVWSEPVFCLSVDVALLALVRVSKAGPTVRRLGVLVVAVNVAALFRYAVIPMLAVVAAGVLIPSVRRLGRGRGTLAAGAVTALCATTLAAVTVGNLLQGEDATGPRTPSVYGPVAVGRMLLDVAGQLFLNAEVTLPAALSGALLLVVLGLVLRWSVRLGARRLLDHPVLPVLLWAGGYVAFAAAGELANDMNRLDFRLMSPVAPSLAIVVALALGSATRPLGHRSRRLLLGGYLALAAVLAAGWVASSLVHGVPSWLPDRPHQDRAVAAAVAAAVPAGATLASDDPWRLAWITDRDLVRGVPDAGPYPEDTPEFIPRNQAAAARPGDYVVLFFDTSPSTGLLPLRLTSDFGLYRVPQS